MIKRLQEMLARSKIPPWLLIGGTALFSIGLFALSIFLRPAPEPSLPTDLPAMLPSPTWDTLPTRIPSPTPTIAGSIPLQEMRAALRRKDWATASTAWEEALHQAPEDGLVYREGARLALALDDLVTAETRIWKAVRLLPEDSETWGLMGRILARQGEAKAAEQAFGVAAAISPEITADVFIDRWRAAREAKDTQKLAELAQAYKEASDDDNLLTFYYNATVLTASGDPNTAISQLVAVLHSAPDAPAALWYALGEAYLAREAFTETFTVMEVAGFRMAQGDGSISLIGQHPGRDLNLNLAFAYMGVGRCAEAESILRRWRATMPELAPLIEEAIICQTPTPTWTPWMLSQQSTPTPTPAATPTPTPEGATQP